MPSHDIIDNRGEKLVDHRTFHLEDQSFPKIVCSEALI